MNGLTNTFLTLLLGWLRSLFNAVWALLGSGGGGSMLNFLRLHWKMLFLVLCIGGFVLDAMIYLFRWRPYYVWVSRRRVRKARKRGRLNEPSAQEPERPAEEESQYTQTYNPPSEEYPEETVRYQPPERAGASPGFAPTYRYVPETARRPEPPAYEPEPPELTEYEDSTIAYSPTGNDPYAFAPAISPSAPTVAYGRPWTPPVAQDEPSGDAILPNEALSQATIQTFAPPEPAAPAPTAPVGRRVARLQSEQYLRDVRSGFAPPPEPEELYSQADFFAPADSVHPGLDSQTFQQSVGLNRGKTNTADEAVDPQTAYPNFAPFSAPTPQESQSEKPRVLGTLAKKARSFVNGEDENNPPSIHDLQSTVDVSSAFHAPVYPKKNPESRDE